MDEELTAFCPVYQRAVEIIGNRWNGAIVRALLAGASRFSEIEADIPGLSPRLLSQRLRELEGEGILTRTVHPEMPVRIEYRLRPKGQALASVVKSVSDWAERWLRPPESLVSVSLVSGEAGDERPET